MISISLSTVSTPTPIGAMSERRAVSLLPRGMLEEESPRVPSKGWAEMIRKVYEVDPMTCPRCGGRMRAVPGRDILFL